MSATPDDVQLADQFKAHFDQLRQQIGTVITGQQQAVDQLLTSIFCNGHCLLVGVPGLAKTLLVQTVAKSLSLSFNRIQFTPDLMPTDILGAEILDENRQFKFIRGPIFSQLILADEINRTPPKTQSALLEAMQEKTVTVAGEHMELDKPFFVLATQNPIEQEGTYPLPEAQLDRFMFMLTLDYPSRAEEVEIVTRTTGASLPEVQPLLTQEDILTYQGLVRRVPVAEGVVEYAVDLVNKTRPSVEGASDYTKKHLDWGAGPRASQYLVLGAKAHALLSGRYSPDKEDVQAVALPVLRHRLVPSFLADAEGLTTSDIIKTLL